MQLPPGSLMPHNMPPLGVPPPIGMPPLGPAHGAGPNAHHPGGPSISSLLGSQILGGMPPPVSMPNMPPGMPAPQQLSKYKRNF